LTERGCALRRPRLDACRLLAIRERKGPPVFPPADPARLLEATPGFEPGIKALQASALPLGDVAILRSERVGPVLKAESRSGANTRNRLSKVIYGADDGIRTRDPNLGKVVLYQLSHVRTRKAQGVG
jgi:hypothetical protein